MKDEDLSYILDKRPEVELPEPGRDRYKYWKYDLMIGGVLALAGFGAVALTANIVELVLVLLGAG